MELKTISFKGVTRTPDNIAAPGDLAIAMNVVNDGAGLEMMEQPEVVFELTEGETFLAIHKGTGYLHYITDILSGTTHTLTSVTINGDTVTRTAITTTNGAPSVEIIGNTIIYNDADGIHYVLWKDNAYINLGQKPPKLLINFALDSEFVACPNSGDPYTFVDRPYTSQVALPVYSDGNESDGIYVPPLDVYGSWDHDAGVGPSDTFIYNTDFPASYSLEGRESVDDNSKEKTNDYVGKLTDAILGKINQLIQEQTENNRFIFPFFVRYAYRLYDGSHIMHSEPVLLIPNSMGPVFALDGKQGLMMTRRYKGNTYEKIIAKFRGRAYAFASTLQYQMVSVDNSIRNWEDIVTGVDIFASLPVYTFEQGKNVWGWKHMGGDTAAAVETKWEKYFSICKMNPQVDNEPLDLQYRKQTFSRIFKQRNKEINQVYTFSEPYDSADNHQLPEFIMSLPMRSETEILKRLEETATFYRIASLDFFDISTGGVSLITLPIEDGTLLNLSTQQLLDDDFYSNDIMSADVTTNYNHRLLVAEPSRTPHSPMPPFAAWMRYRTTTQKIWENHVAIKNKTGDSDIVVGNEAYSWNELTPTALSSFAVAYNYAQYYTNNGTCIAATANTDLHVYKNLTPGDKLRITMTNQLGQITTAAFLNGNTNTEDPDESPGPSVLHNTAVTPHAAYVYLRAYYQTPTSDTVVVTVPQGTDELAVTVYNNHNGTAASVVVEKLVQVQGVDELSRYDGDFPLFVFYPNPDAYKAQFFDGSTYREVKLTEHTALNGAYWLRNFYSDSLPSSITIKNYSDINNKVIPAPSEIAMSHADNPFNFAPSNQDKIGSGKILALCPAVRPLSEGQFGYANLYVFTTDGVWAMQVSTKDGTFSNIAPVTRDVLSEGSKPLSLDTSVVFQAPRGIMLLTGSKAQCISEAINGDVWRVPNIGNTLNAALGSDSIYNAVDHLLNTPTSAPALMAYDYTNQRVYVSPIGKAFSWVYNLKSGVWTQSSTHVTSAVNTYPGCVFAEGGNVVELLENNRFDRCAIITRPLCFAPLALQKIRELKGLTVDDGGTWCSVLWATRDWRRYAAIMSNMGEHPRMCRMGGSPWKAHVLGLFYTGNSELSLTHDTIMSIAGASIAYDVEQNNRMR